MYQDDQSVTALKSCATGVPARLWYRSVLELTCFRHVAFHHALLGETSAGMSSSRATSTLSTTASLADGGLAWSAPRAASIVAIPRLWYSVAPKWKLLRFFGTPPDVMTLNASESGFFVCKTRGGTTMGIPWLESSGFSLETQLLSSR
eukprot:m.389289 g.389289  ORF g.389289 m.389289 type:complete len:148 (+) comp21049_c0_seq5:1076-1519(+)